MKGFEYGWISPTGDVYECGFRGHRLCAENIRKGRKESEDSEKLLEKMGWVKVTKDVTMAPTSDRRAVLARGMFITKRQADTLLSLGYGNNQDFKDLLECSECRW